MNAEDYKITMKLLRKITDNLIDLSNNNLVDFGNIERTVKLAETVENILTNNLYRRRNVEIKIKNNNMEMYSNNSVNISICNNDINKGHSNIINNDDELEIDTKIYTTLDHEDIAELINKHFADCVRKMNLAKTTGELNSAYNMAKCYYIALLKNPITTGEFKKIYNKNKARINNQVI